MTKKAVTIKDVAKKAKVAISTVSAVLNNSAPVSEATQARVLAAMEALDFLPNKIARSLRMQKTFTIGVVVPNLINPFFPEVVRGIQATAHANHYHIILCDAEDDPHQAISSINSLIRAKVDALILFGETIEKVLSDFRLFKDQTIPIVSVERNFNVPGTHAVLVDVFTGAYQAVRHLAENDYRRIGFVCPKLTLGLSRRYRGYQVALKDEGIAMEESLVQQTSNSFEGGLLAATSLLEQKNPPQAIFAYNDLMAIGVLAIAQEKGLKVPDDLAVMGFDDIHAAAFASPPLSTVALPKQELGALAMQTALRLLKKMEVPRTAILLPSLVIRSSSTRMKGKQDTNHEIGERRIIARTMESLKRA